MQNQAQIQKIEEFLSLAGPLVVQIAEGVLKSFNWQVTQKGEGLNIVFHIRAGDKQIDFFLHNLLMEIATTDRDKEPLEFDENLQDFDFFMAKTTRLTESKFRVLLPLLGQENVDAAIEGILSEAGSNYERIRIWRFDQAKSGHGPKP